MHLWNKEEENLDDICNPGYYLSLLFFVGMLGKVFLKRKIFVGINLANIILNVALAVNDGLRGTDKVALRISAALYYLAVSVLIYLLSIRRISIRSMLYFIYLAFSHSLILLLIGFLRFLFKFQANKLSEIFIGSIPIFSVILISLGSAMFVIIVRKYIVQGIVYPTSMQREKGIEETILILRKEYPEIFR